MKERVNADLGRVLVIDDNPQNVLLIRGQLEREGYVVDSVLSGREGLDSALAEAPDLILLDIMMPGLDGYQVCRLLRENESTSAVPVIVLTSLNEKTDKMQAYENGADDFLSKPVDRAELLSRVRSLLRMRRLYEERGRYKEQFEREQAETAGLEEAIKTERALRANEERFRKQYKGIPVQRRDGGYRGRQGDAAGGHPAGPDTRFACEAHLAGQRQMARPLVAFLTTTRRIQAHVDGLLGAIWCAPGPNSSVSERMRVCWLPALGSSGLGPMRQATARPLSRHEVEYTVSKWG